MGHALMENGNGLLMDFVVSRATGMAEREAVPVMLDDARQRGYRPRTLGGDKGYDTRGCVKEMRDRGVTPHVAQRTHSAIDGRTTRHGGYRTSQKVRKQVEEIFGWMKTLSGRDWLATLWLRLTTWCGWRTWCRVRGPGPLIRCDLPGVHCAPMA